MQYIFICSWAHNHNCKTVYPSSHTHKKSSVKRLLSLFFHDVNPFESLIHMLKYFLIGFNFAEVFPCAKHLAQLIPGHCRVKLTRVIDTTESNLAVSLTLQSQNYKCHWHYRVKLRNVVDTQSQTYKCHWHFRVKLTSVIDTTESNLAVSLTLQSQAYKCHWHCRVKLRNVVNTSESSRFSFIFRIFRSTSTQYTALLLMCTFKRKTNKYFSKTYNAFLTIILYCTVVYSK